jgi:hypothetical protein
MESNRQIAYAYKRVFEGINYRLRNFAGGRFASYCRPTSVVLLLTEHCNARCVHCDIWKNTEHKTLSAPGGGPVEQTTNLNIDVSKATTEQLKQIQSLIDAGVFRDPTDTT